MYIFGLLVYIAIPLMAFFVEVARGFVTQCFELSPEITALIMISYLYPLSVFIGSFFFRHHKFANIEYFRTQVTLSSSLAVSFGLIGTFIGLANMIAGIAAGLNADGDFTQRMAMLLESIGLALDSMSLAFLTSILGVGTSVSILFAANFLNSFFDQHADDDVQAGPTEKVADILDGDINVINENFERVHGTVQQTLDLVSAKDKVWLDLFTLLENNSGATVVQQFNASLMKNNAIATEQAEQIISMRDEQRRTNENAERILSEHSANMNTIVNAASNALNSMSEQMEMLATTNKNVEVLMAEHTRKMQTEISSSTNSVDNMSGSVDSMASSIAQSSEITHTVIEKTTDELDKVASILHDIRVATALPIEESLKNALREGSFTLVYQPQTFENGSLVGAETFIRWVDPVRGPISNGELFELAEREKLSVDLDKWVINTAIHQVSEWQKAGLWVNEWVVSINVTSALVLDPSFVNTMETALKKSDVLPGCIAVEITEDTIMGHSESARDKVRQLHSLGLKIFIDDFGTGYTSLINLRDFEIDRLKIDRAITNSLSDSDGTGLAVIKSAMVMAEQMKIEFAAEGVETKDQLDTLAEAGCNFFQGYYIGKPVASDEFEKDYLQKEV